jgi:hypothetical protein
MGVPTAGPGMLKFVTVALYVMVLLGLVLNVGKGVAVAVKERRYTPLLDATAGQIFQWDQNIYNGIQRLKNDNLINSLPPEYREDYRNFIIRQVTFSVMLFAILTYFLFKIGNWLLGIHSFSWHTDVLILLAILLIIFPFSEFIYGAFVHKEYIVPYQGVALLVKPSTWELLLGDLDKIENPYQPADDMYKGIVINTSVG